MRPLLLLPLVFALAGAPPPQPASPAPDVLGASPSCTAFVGLDRKRLAARQGELPSHLADAEAMWRRLPLADQPPAGFDAGAIRGWSGSSFARSAHTFRAFASPSGGWRVRTASFSPDGDTAEEFDLAPDLAARLNFALRQGCLADEPSVLPNAIPMQGETALYECADGEAVLLDIAVGRVRRTAYQNCFSAGFTGEIAAVLAEGRYRAIGPERQR